MNFNTLFKLISETSEEFLPKMFQILKNDSSPLIGVHFSSGIIKDPKHDINKVAFPKMKTTQFLGKNFKPAHADPFGIYAFPKDYVLKGGLQNNIGFASKPYIFILKPSSKASILNLDMTEEKAVSVLNQMGIPRSFYDREDLWHSGSRGKELLPGHRFWSAIEVYKKENDLSRNSSWNILFNKTQYNTLYDPGLKIVHPNEPSQIIYLKKEAYEVVDVINQRPFRDILKRIKSEFPNFKVRKKDTYENINFDFHSPNNYFNLFFDKNRYALTAKVNGKDGHILFTTYPDHSNYGIKSKHDNIESFINAIKQELKEEKNENPTDPIIQKIAKLFGVKIDKDQYDNTIMIERYYIRKETEYNYSRQKDEIKQYKILFKIYGYTSKYTENSRIGILLRCDPVQKSWISNSGHYSFNDFIEIDGSESIIPLVNKLFNLIYKEIYNLNKKSNQDIEKSESYNAYFYESLERSKNALKDLNFIRKRVFPKFPTRSRKNK